MMDETPREPPPDPGERIERRETVEEGAAGTPPGRGDRIERQEVVERGSTGAPPPPRGGVPLLIWVIPLVLVALVLVWFIFTRGEPRAPTFPSPGDDVEVEVQPPESPAPDVQIEVQPAPPAEPAPEPAEPAEPAEPNGL